MKMLMIKRLLNINLHLFDGEGGGGSPAASGEGTLGANADMQTASTGKKQGEKVVYGKQPEPAPKGDQSATDQNANNTLDPEARKAEFEKYISENKDLFTDRVQGVIDKRFKETKILEKQLGDTKPILEVLMSKYNIQNGDVNALAKAIETDDAYWEELADKEGLTVEQYKHKQKLEVENRQLRQQTNDIDAQRRSQQIYNNWLQQEPIVQQKYPDFNLEKESENQTFVEMISRGVDLKAAYEVIHMDEIMNGVAKQVENNVANTIRANGQRPAENGTSSQSGVIVKNDVSKLTKADRAEIAKQAQRGIPIKF
jgi:hypothetical protein